MAWSPTFGRDIVEAFRDFCERHFVDPDQWDADSLGTYIEHWFHQGTDEIIRLTGGNFTAWLEAVLIIIDAYGKDPSIIDFTGDNVKVHLPSERRVKRMLALEEWGVSFLDSHRYRTLVVGGE